MLYACCRRCGTPILQRVPRRIVTESAFLRGLTLIFGFRAYRCDRCRNNFFAIRPMFRHPDEPAGDDALGVSRGYLP